MKKIALSAMMTFCFSFYALAEELIDGFTLSSAQSSLGGEKNYSPGLSGLISMRPTSRYATEFQLGLFGQSGPYDYSVLLDGAAAGFLPLGNSGFNLYGKAGLAIIYSVESTGYAGILAPTYGAGLEFKGKKRVVRLGFQRYNVGRASASPALGTNLVGISFMRLVE